MKKILRQAALMFVLLSPSFALSTQLACNKQQGEAVVATAVKVAVDLCQEAPALVPSGAQGVTALVCQAVEQNAKSITVLIDTVIWGSLKAAYVREHGRLPTADAGTGG